MVSSRALAALALTASLLIAACSGGSDDSAAKTQPTSRPTEPSTATLPTTTAAAPDLEAVTYEQLATQAIDGEVDELTLVLSEFAALFGVDVPGAIALQVDESLPTLGTDVLQEITRLDDQLTNAQRSIIAARLDEVLVGEVVYDTSDDPEYQALFDGRGDDIATTEPEGFAPRRRADSTQSSSARSRTERRSSTRSNSAADRWTWMCALRRPKQRGRRGWTG